MKKSQSIKRTLAVVLSMSVLSFSMITCKNPVEGLQLNMNSGGIFNNTIAVRFENANSNSTEFAPGSSLRVKITGEDAAEIFTLGGSRTFLPANGFLNLAVNPNLVATKQNPIRFNIIATAGSYADVNYEVVITESGTSVVNVPMVKLDELPTGVAYGENRHTIDSEGKSAADMELKLDPSVNNPEGFHVKVPAGVALLDASGNPLSGEVKMMAIHYSDREAALKAKPGGAIASRVVDPNGNPLPSLLLESMGSVSLTINETSTGKKVKKFSQPIDLEIDINPTSKHPKTGALIKEGDSIPVFSRDEETGVRILEGNTVVRKAPNSNKLVANVKVPHLSDWEVAFFSNSPDGSCSNPTVTINYTGDFDFLNIFYYNNKTGKYIGSDFHLIVYGENKIELSSADVEAYCILQTTYDLLTTGVIPLCGGSTSATIEGEDNPQVDIEIKAVCGDPAAPTRIIYPTFQVMYKETGSPLKFEILGNVTNGKISTKKFKQGKSYTFGASYEGKWYEYTRLIDQTSYNETMALPPTNNVCK
jgi:hypothetical protein